MALLHNIPDRTTLRTSPDGSPAAGQRKPSQPDARGERGSRSRCLTSHWRSLFAAVCWSVRVVAGPELGAAERQPQETGRAVLDLSKKETFQLLDVNADPAQVIIEHVEVEELPAKHHLMPKSGTAQLGRPLDIQLEQPANVRIRLALVRRGNGVALRISPQIVIGQHNTIDLTRDRVTRTTRNFLRRVKDLRQQLSALAAERQALHVWLISPGNKPLSAVKQAHFRLKILDRAIKARQQEIPLAQQQCVALGQAAEFVRKLHKHVEIRYEVRIEQPED